jgi:heat shock protein HslJ
VITGAAVVLLIASVGLATALGLTTALWASAPEDLAGSHWNLVEIDGQAPIALPEGGLTIGFEAEGQVGGSSGCNSYGGQYAVQSSNLSLSEVVSTLRACADEALNAQEAQFHQALAAVAQYDVQGDTLTLRDAGGAALLVFERA